MKIIFLKLYYLLKNVMKLFFYSIHTNLYEEKEIYILIHTRNLLKFKFKFKPFSMELTP